MSWLQHSPLQKNQAISETPIGCCEALQLDLARLALGLETQWGLVGGQLAMGDWPLKKEGRIIILAYLRYLLNRRVKVREYCHCSYLVNDLQLICQTKLHPVWASNPLAPKHWNGKLAKFKQLIIIIPRWSESLTIAWIEQKSVLHRKFSGPNWRVTTNKEQGTLQIWLIWLLSFDWVVSNKYMLI